MSAIDFGTISMVASVLAALGSWVIEKLGFYDFSNSFHFITIIGIIVSFIIILVGRSVLKNDDERKAELIRVKQAEDQRKKPAPAAESSISRQNAMRTAQAAPSPKPSASRTVPQPPLKTIDLPLINALGYAPTYKYEDVRIAMYDQYKNNSSQLRHGQLLSFEKEPSNQYDSNAVMILADNKQIGYVYKGTLQDMINQYLSRHDIVEGYLQMDNVDDNPTFTLAFYKEDGLKSMKSKGKAKSGTLTRSGSVEAQENILFLSPGDELTVSENYETGKYEVESSLGFIGDLPVSLHDYAETADFVVECINDKDNGKQSVTVAAILAQD